VEEAAKRWSLEVLPPFQPGGVCSWAAPARRGGTNVVLKAAWLHEENLHEAEALRSWGGVGAVILLDEFAATATRMMLLEACIPGTPLSESLPPAAQDEVLAGLLTRLWVEPDPEVAWRSLESMCRWWADEYEAKYDDAEPHRRLDRGLSGAGIELFRSLPATSDRYVLLGTDVHPDNVLAAEREPWLVIDPKPYVGDPSYDLLQHMVNHPDRLVADPRGFARRMSVLAGLDSERVDLWLFARAVQESLDLPFMKEIAPVLAPST
jgi:streptomycin 6-kinase